MELDINDLGFAYDDRNPLFEHVNIHLKDCDILNILGTNGSGKTTFARCLLNTETRCSGKILFNKHDSSKMSIRERAEYIGYIGLGSDIPLYLTVEEYVTLGNAVSLKCFEKPSVIHLQKAETAMKKINIFDLRSRSMYMLSQGERQLASIARLLVQDPKIVIFDEPTASLDLANKKIILMLIEQLCNEKKIIINITHDPDHAFRLGGYALLIGKGETNFGTVEETLTEEKLSRLYDVDIRILCDEAIYKTAMMI